MIRLKRLDLLVKEVKDPHSQENFWRIKQYIDRIDQAGIVGPQGPQGPVGPAGPQGDSFWEQIQITIPAATTLTVDTVALANFSQIEYFLNYKNTVTNKSRSLKCAVLNDDSSISEQVYGIFGTALDVDLATAVVGPNYELQLTNNEASPVDVFITKTILT